MKSARRQLDLSGGIFIYHKRPVRFAFCYFYGASMGGCVCEKRLFKHRYREFEVLPTGKGLMIYGWVIMTNHIHLIMRSNKTPLSDIIRDFKKYTATQIVKAIRENQRESRKSWLLWLFKKEDKIWFWEEGYHGEEIFSKDFFDTKLKYIHQNPVRAGIVEKEEEYLLSSCGDYYGIRKGLLGLAAV